MFRPSTGAWYIPGFGPITWGGGDIPVAGDYDGDGKADVAVFRPRTAHGHRAVEDANECLRLGWWW